MKKVMKPHWIGLHIPLSEGYINVCIGINQEDGHEVTFYTEADLEQWENLPDDSEDKRQGPWCYGGPNIGEIEIAVSEGVDGRVFDDNHKLIKPAII